MAALTAGCRAAAMIAGKMPIDGYAELQRYFNLISVRIFVPTGAPFTYRIAASSRLTDSNMTA